MTSSAPNGWYRYVHKERHCGKCLHWRNNLDALWRASYMKFPTPDWSGKFCLVRLGNFQGQWRVKQDAVVAIIYVQWWHSVTNQLWTLGCNTISKSLCMMITDAESLQLPVLGKSFCSDFFSFSFLHWRDQTKQCDHKSAGFMSHRNLQQVIRDPRERLHACFPGLTGLLDKNCWGLSQTFNKIFELRRFTSLGVCMHSEFHLTLCISHLPEWEKLPLWNLQQLRKLICHKTGIILGEEIEAWWKKDTSSTMLC